MLKSNVTPRTYDYCGACSFYLGAIIVTLICQATSGVISAALTAAYPDISGNSDFSTAFMMFVQAANGAFIILFTKLNRYKFDFSYVTRGGSGRVEPSTFVVPVIGAALLMIAMYLPTLWYGYFTTYALGVSPELGNINLDTVSSVVMIVIASVFLAPVCEEAVYRGVLFNGLKKYRSVLGAVLFSALAFMLMHMSPVQVVFQFSLGAASAYIMHRSDRMLPSVLFHATANALALVMQLTPFAGVLVGCEAWLVSHVAAAFFITLGLLAGAGGALYALIRFGFDIKLLGNAPKTETTDQAPQPDGDNVVRDAAIEVARRKDGTFRYWVAIVICGVVFVASLIVSVI